MEAAFYPGSFDPVTYGHLNIIERALDIFDRVTVLMAVNPHKQTLFTPEENMEMIREVTRPWPQVEVDRDRRIRIAVRGLRAVTDFENEFAMALTNRSLWPEFDTVFLMTRSDYMYLSSTVVRQIAEMGGEIDQFVPPCVARRLREKFASG